MHNLLSHEYFLRVFAPWRLCVVFPLLVQHYIIFGVPALTVTLRKPSLLFFLCVS